MEHTKTSQLNDQREQKGYNTSIKRVCSVHAINPADYSTSREKWSIIANEHSIVRIRVILSNKMILQSIENENISGCFVGPISTPFALFCIRSCLCVRVCDACAHVHVRVRDDI